MTRTVQDVMTRDVVAVRGTTAFKELVRLLSEDRITALPVLDDTGRVVVGVVSETDLALKEVAPLRDGHTPLFETAQHRDERARAASLTAAELMTSPAVTAAPEEPVAAAARRGRGREPPGLAGRRRRRGACAPRAGAMAVTRTVTPCPPAGRTPGVSGGRRPAAAAG